MKKRSRVTLQQVAQHAGVSRATASLIVRGSESISKETKEKVLQSMKELGYVYDRIAANLRSQHSSTVGFIISEIGNPFFSEVLVGVHKALDKEGYTVILGTTFDLMAKQQALLSTMLEYRVGGVIISPIPGTSHEDIERLEQLGMPVVIATRETTFPEKFDYVGVDNVLGGKLAIQHLIEKGHRRIAFLGGTNDSSVWRDRMRGYMDALVEAGFEVDPALLVETPVSRKGGMDAIKQVLSLPQPPTAAFCYNDIVALGVMSGLKDAGIHIGQEFNLVGFDNIQEASMVTPSLTTVDAFPHAIGEYASDLLHQRMMGLSEGPKRIILKPELIVRES
ncbi:LacI family DNA-binding transcriptional regulator [Ammoniphilus sp. YIM 78166]|uniref:LacI family DNA-binding transcriptional regulator n=1 Tax=Ammoniphilus sp. YIM 78166 TaxID=1644106 RepID=UPI001070455D|nr:LacI family DNA-binding transcriptional regulator [Ammoniphilus sp. YIM 78166]